MSSENLLNIFLILMIGIYVINHLTKGLVLSLFELDSNKIRNSHQYYRLFSFGFLHGDLIHLALNILILKNVIYPFFENKISFTFFMVIFIFSTVITGIALIIYYSNVEFTFVGSSVGFYSFFGLMTVYYFNNSWDFFINNLSKYPFYTNDLVWSILIFILGNILTSYWERFKTFSGLFAHISSFIVGLVIGILININ